jgi:hypothetical protein
MELVVLSAVVAAAVHFLQCDPRQASTLQATVINQPASPAGWQPMKDQHHGYS